MGQGLQLRVYENAELKFIHDFQGPIELGRQDAGEEEPFHVKQVSGRQRVIIARRDEQTISRKYILVEGQGNDIVRLINLSDTLPVRLPDGTELGHKAVRDFPRPVILALGKITLRIQEPESDEPVIQGLAEATLPPRLGSLDQFPFQTISLPAYGDGKEFLAWMRAAMDVLQSAVSSADFFDKAARAAVNLVNLDSARILLRSNDDWITRSVYTSPKIGYDQEWHPSRGVLSRVFEQKRTARQVPDLSAPLHASLKDIKAVVAAPILNCHNEVIGALYGDRRRESLLTTSGPITELEASLVELLARGVAAGLARLDQEREILKARVRFEQFFSPQLAQQLELHPDMLQGRDEEVTLLFCDIRGFSRISERLGPARTVAWISNTMAVLSECIRDRHGVVVDYIGDELMAMWGAPEPQPNHARLAALAALDVLARLPELNQRWQAELQEPMAFGIGINTGTAHVGNVGSPHKFKYGPLGDSVNLASRVQGATKYLKCRLLLTGATQRQLDASFITRRLATVRVVNIKKPVELYELSPADRPNWREAKEEYEKALGMFERKEFLLAARTLGNWRARLPDDGPALVLLHRAIQCEVEEPQPFDPVWELPGK